MGDLSAYASALGIKPKPTSNPPAGSGIVTPDQQMPDTSDGSPSDIAELKQAIASAPDANARQTLTTLLQQKTAAADQSARLAPYAAALGLGANKAAQSAPEAQQAQSLQQAKPAEQPSLLASLGAGAGKAAGTGVLALQQLAGKGLSYVGGIGQDEAAPQNAVQKAGNWLSNDAVQGVQKLNAENAPYAEANPKTNVAGEVAGAVLSPINKLVPGLGASGSLAGAATRGAAQGAILNTLTAPVTDDGKSFIDEKLKQAAIGSVGGTLGGALGYGLSKGISAGIDAIKNSVSRVTSGDTNTAADAVVSDALGKIGVNKENITPELFDGLKAQVAQAVKTGKSIDQSALVRLTQAQTLPVQVPMLQGQISRDAMQFAKEQNLRGINGVGEPITDVLTAQNKALIGNLDALGANKGSDVVSAGQSAISTLQSADAKAQKVVGAAYDAFKQSTGKSLDVPLQGLAQDYTKTVDEFGDAIPKAISKKFEDLGLLSGVAKKTFSIDDAEGLIKSINRNYDPSNKVQARALDELRNSVQNAIADGAGSNAQGAEAAFLAKSAREAAALRFAGMKATPALKDAVNGAEPDRFIQKHILQGNQAQIKNMMDVLSAEDPQAVTALQDSVMGFIKGRVLNGNSAENGVFSQAQLKQFVNDPNSSARLTQVLGPQKMATLKQLNAVAENALFAPKGAAINSSNTASAAANLIKSEVQGGSVNSLLSLGRQVPGLATASNAAQQFVQGRKAAALVDEAVNPSLGKQVGSTPVRDLTALGARAGSAYVGAKTRQNARP